MTTMEERLRFLAESGFAFLEPGHPRSCDSSDQRAGVTPKGDDALKTWQRAAVDEAEAVLQLLSATAAMAPAPAPGPPRKRGPLGSTATLPAAPSLLSPVPAVTMHDGRQQQHRARYMCAACRAPVMQAVGHLEQALECGSRLAAVELALHALTAARYADALPLLDTASTRGHPAAMLAVGRCLRDGLGVPVDPAAARCWVERAAALGYAPALHEYGEVLEAGDLNDTPATGDQRDIVGAFRAYRAAAEKHYAPAQLNLAKLYLTASQLGLAQAAGDATFKARYWLERAGAGGCLEAASLLQRSAPSHEDPERSPPRIPVKPYTP